MTIPSNLSLRNKNSLEEKSTKKENEIYDKVMNDFGNITRFTNISESDRLMKDGVYAGFGKRKRARANAYIKPGSGKVTVNGIPAHKYISDTVYRGKLFAPLVLTGTSAIVDVKLIMFGGGISGQMDAAVPAISKALVRMNPEFAEILAKCKIFLNFFHILILIILLSAFFLSHDPRNVEPKKAGRIKARKGYVYNRR
jgi:small subunit ribosomal protein S9